MNEKIMALIQLAMEFKGFEKVANVEFASHINGVIVCVSNEQNKLVYMEICYLDHTDAGERLDSIKEDLEKMLKESNAA